MYSEANKNQPLGVLNQEPLVLEDDCEFMVTTPNNKDNKQVKKIAEKKANEVMMNIPGEKVSDDLLPIFRTFERALLKEYYTYIFTLPESEQNYGITIFDVLRAIGNKLDKRVFGVITDEDFQMKVYLSVQDRLNRMSRISSYLNNNPDNIMDGQYTPCFRQGNFIVFRNVNDEEKYAIANIKDMDWEMQCVFGYQNYGCE